MSTTIYEKFTAEMQRLADERDLDLIVHGTDRVGHYEFQTRKGFDSILLFPYEFRPDKSSFADTGPEGGAKSELGPMHEETEYGFYEVQGREHVKVIVRVGEVLDGNGYRPGRREDSVLREEALTQIQHLAYDGSFQLESRSVKGDDALTLARVRLDRINAIAEGMHPDEQWIPIEEDGAGDVVRGGDRELLQAEDRRTA